MDMDAIYDDMLKRSQELDITFHPSIHDSNDPDRCLAIYTLLDTNNMTCTKFGDHLFKQLKDIEDTFSYQPGHGLHITWFQLQAMGKTDLCSSYKYIHVLSKHCPTLLNVNISFERLVLTKNSLVALGYPDKSVNDWRESLRTQLHESNVPFCEPYKSDLVHCTLLRFSNRPPSIHTKKLLRIIEQIRTPLFTVKIQNIDTGYSSWQMLSNQLNRIYTIGLS